MQLGKGMDKRQQEINTVTKEIHGIEDAIFADFCRAVGVANIREYEQQQLKDAQEMSEGKLRIADQQSKLQNQ